MARFSFILATLLLALRVSAGPVIEERQLDAIPQEAKKLAVDDATNRIVVFDDADKYLGFIEPGSTTAAATRRAGGACSALSADDAQKLPGWEKLKADAISRWGDGSWNIVTNDPDYPDSPASVCAQDAGPVTVNGTPSCKSSTQTLDTTVTGTSGTATVSQITGTSYSAQQTVTQSSSLSIGESVTVKVGIPEVADVTAATTLETSFTNTLATTTTSESNQQTTQSVAIAVPDGKTCKISFKQTSCTTQGSGQVPFTATGWVWFEYNDRTQGHYKWALQMDGSLSAEERSSYMKFDTVVATDTKGEYSANC
ncbi:hypothetical protein GGG16DRAFT_49413 [Schizophyllum commune]